MVRAKVRLVELKALVDAYGRPLFVHAMPMLFSKCHLAAGASLYAI